MGQIFRLRDIMYGVRKHLGVVIATTLCGLVIGAMLFIVQSFSASNTVEYQIYASFSISTINSAGVFTNEKESPSMSDFELASELMPAVIYVCQSEKVANEVISRLNLVGVSTRSVQRALSMSQQDETSVMSITLNWSDRDEGISILEAILDVLPSALQEVFMIGEIKIIEPPVATEISTDTSKSIIMMLTGVGFLIGMLYCFSQLYLHPTLIEIKDVNDLFEMNLLTDIDDEPEYTGYLTENLITNRDDLPTGFRENYTALAHILLHQMEDEHFCLFVTSAMRGEGKTTVVANLGLELAALDKRVLLIDFDLTNPTLGSCFLDEIAYLNTVNAVYFDENSAKGAIVKINENLDLLPASLDKRHMGINKFAKKLVAQLEEEYDIILLDTEPVGESSEMLYFSNVSNSALFIIRYDYTPCDVIESSIEKLRKTSTTIQGAVVNRVVHLNFGLPGTNELDKSGSKGLLDKLKFKPKEKTPKQPKKAVREDDDSDLKDDELLKEILQQLSSGNGSRRTQAMMCDDDLDNMARPDETVPASAAPAQAKAARNRTGVKKSKSEPVKTEAPQPQPEGDEDFSADKILKDIDDFDDFNPGGSDSSHSTLGHDDWNDDDF